MSEFSITPEKVELEDGDIEIVRLNDNLIFRDNAQGLTLTIDQDTELSQLWNAFDSSIDTSQFFQENASGLAELLSGYTGIDLAGENIENANVVSANEVDAESVNTENAAVNISEGGVNTNLPTYQIDGPEGLMRDNFRITETVGTTATPIASVQDNPVGSGLITVIGFEIGVSGRRFTDVVAFARSADVVDVISQISHGDPEARSYETDSFDGELKLSMETEDYQVATRIIETRMNT